MTVLKRAPAALLMCAGVFLCAQTSHAATETIKASPVTGSQATEVTPATAGVSEDAGWNKSFGLLFSFNGFLDNILNDFQGGFGGQYNLDSKSALRVSLTLSRASYPAVVVKTTTKTGGTTVVTYNVATTNSVSVLGQQNWPLTASMNTNLWVDYLMRMTAHSVSPYYGVGLNVGWLHYEGKYTDDVSVANQTTTFNNNYDRLGVGARGILGVGWRIHEHFEIFAEYDLSLTIAQAEKLKLQNTVTNTSGGINATNQTTNDSSITRGLNYTLDINNGAMLGLIAFF
jgi:hypothetical protein